MTSGKKKIMGMSMREYAHLTHFRSCDVKNIIFLNTDVTSSFLMLKTSCKNKNYPIHFLRSAQYKINIFLCRNWQETSCELYYYADENFDMLSVTMPDRL